MWHVLFETYYSTEFIDSGGMMQPSKLARYLAVLLTLFSFPIPHYNESVTDAGRPIKLCVFVLLCTYVCVHVCVHVEHAGVQ